MLCFVGEKDMTKINHERPPVVPAGERLNHSGDPLQAHLEATRAMKKALAERLKATVAKSSGPNRLPTLEPTDLVKCGRCLVIVKFGNLERHKSRSCKPKKLFPSKNSKAATARVKCMHCSRQVANMKAHILAKHGFMLLPDGTLTVTSAGPQSP